MPGTVIGSLQSFVHRLTTHSPLNVAERDALLSLPAELRRFKAKALLAQQGERVDSVSIVVDGLVASALYSFAGERQIVALHIAGDAADLSTVALEEPFGDLEALVDSTVLRLPRAELRSVVQDHPRIAEAFWRDAALDARVLAAWAINVGRKNARGRLSHLFCEMAFRYGQRLGTPSLDYPLPMTQEQLGAATALTAVHVNRSIRALQRAGFIAVRKGIVAILDWDALCAEAEFNPRYLTAGRSGGHE